VLLLLHCSTVLYRPRPNPVCVRMRAATVMDVPAGGLLEDRIDRAWFFAGGPPLPPPPAGDADPAPPPMRQHITQQQQWQQQQQQQPNGRKAVAQQHPQQVRDAVGLVWAADEGSDSLETSSVVAESIGGYVRCAARCRDRGCWHCNSGAAAICIWTQTMLMGCV